MYNKKVKFGNRVEVLILVDSIIIIILLLISLLSFYHLLNGILKNSVIENSIV